MIHREFCFRLGYTNLPSLGVFGSMVIYKSSILKKTVRRERKE